LNNHRKEGSAEIYKEEEEMKERPGLYTISEEEDGEGIVDEKEGRKGVE
jgi:hypothetical protein